MAYPRVDQPPARRMTECAPPAVGSAAATRYPRTAALVARASAKGPIPAAVIYPCSAGALAGALEASAAGLIAPVLVGPRDQIDHLAQVHRLDLSAMRLVDASSPLESAHRAAALVKEGEVRLLLKGSLHSDELIKGIAARKAGLLTARRLSHVFVMDIPSHDRLLPIADAAINVAPNLRVKRDITQNAIDLAHTLGISEPKVAALSAIEEVTPAVPSSVDAAALRDMAKRGEIVGGIVDGPLAFDNAISAAAARIKGIVSTVCGEVDVVIVPGIDAGNILYKSLVYLGNAVAGGIVLGLRVPVVLTSRADSMESRVASAAIACLLAHDRAGMQPEPG